MLAIENRPKQILAIQARTNQNAISAEQGAFNAIADKVGSQITYANPIEHNHVKLWRDPKLLLREYNADAVLFLGSGDIDMTETDNPLTERYKRKIRPLADFVLKEGIDALGICLGHQTLLWAAGGTINRLEERKEVGTAPTTLTHAGEKEAIFEGLSSVYKKIYGHKDCVEELPKDAVVLATTERDPHSVVKISNARTTQGHPEITNLDELQTRIDAEHGGLDPYEQTHPFEKPDQTDLIIVNFMNRAGFL